MALVLIKKTAPKKPDPITPVTGEVVEDLEALKELGIIPTPEEKPKAKVILNTGKTAIPPTKNPSHDTIHNGGRIRVSFKLFEWVKDYEEGDTGTVLDSYPANGLAVTDDDPERYRLYKVKMDNPRTDKEYCLLRAWELTKA